MEAACLFCLDGQRNDPCTILRLACLSGEALHAPGSRTFHAKCLTSGVNFWGCAADGCHGKVHFVNKGRKKHRKLCAP